MMQPAFDILTEHGTEVRKPIEVFAKALRSITAGGLPAKVSIRPVKPIVPSGMKPLQPRDPEESQDSSFVVGLAVRPIYRDDHTGTLFPQVLRRLRSQLASAIRKGVTAFMKSAGHSAEMHHDCWGPTCMVKAARLVDQQLCEVSDSFDFLLQVTPTNSDSAWEEFEEGGYQTEPPFTYRPLPFDPNLLKRRLYEIEIERLEDPTLANLFREQQEELDRKLSALRDLNTPQFLHNSLQLFPAPADSFLDLAHTILAHDFENRSSPNVADFVDVEVIVDRAREEIDHYHSQSPEFSATVEIRNDIASGLMVSRDKLLISETAKIRPERVTPILHHEIGTHLVTYFNGRRQPFRQLYAGLAGYNELQEGLAVLAEHLSGGLTPNRLRNLAGRVVAVRMMCDGRSFVETFDKLHEEYDLGARQSFVTTLRAFRGGGFTKDAIYLRGLCGVLDYLKKGHDLEPLYVGKIGLHHVRYIREMRRRGVIESPGVLPRFWNDRKLRKRLEATRGLSVLELLEMDK